jgi:hypothetical protein
MLRYLNKANEEEAVNGRSDRGTERGMSKNEACMNTATTNKGCYSKFSASPATGRGAIQKQLRRRISAPLATDVQSHCFHVTGVMRRTSLHDC